jgi:hypothetical protein
VNAHLEGVADRRDGHILEVVMGKPKQMELFDRARVAAVSPELNARLEKYQEQRDRLGVLVELCKKRLDRREYLIEKLQHRIAETKALANRKRPTSSK